MNKKVLLGMSGGVDSSVSAILLQNQGYEVIGCTMKLWDQDGSEKAIQDAKNVCEKLEIKHYVFDYQKEFKCCVIDNFINEYNQTRTPNPCIECNKYLKFGYFYQKAQELDCSYIATGHYAKIEFSQKYQQYILKKANEEKKDQSYFLYTIPNNMLEHIIFPLQNYTNKEDTRKIAEENGLDIAYKKDSQEICFIPDNDYKSFLRKYSNIKYLNGNIILKTGEILGKHSGIVNYTIGQRKGLGISYKKPLYVIDLDKENNNVIVGFEEELYSKELYVKNISWIVKPEKEEMQCLAKIRYRSKEAKATIILKEDINIVKFDEPQRAITKGQSVVFYDEDGVVLGGGKIDL